MSALRKSRKYLGLGRGAGFRNCWSPSGMEFNDENEPPPLDFARRNMGEFKGGSLGILKEIGVL